MKLKKCPCGKVPDSLEIETIEHRGKYFTCRGSCCGEWCVEFSAGYRDISDKSLLILATEAWNSANRG